MRRSPSTGVNFTDCRSLGTPRGVGFDTEFYSESGGRPPWNYRENEAKKWGAGYDVWATTRRIKDIYVDCGWDVKAREQTNFRKTNSCVDVISTGRM